MGYRATEVSWDKGFKHWKTRNTLGKSDVEYPSGEVLEIDNLIAMD